MCSFCVVPFTRGRERSRDPFTVVSEAAHLFDRGFREVTLLGQNVDSYKWQHPETQEIYTFAKLLEMVALIHPDLRVRFSTSHPKDMTDDVLHVMAGHENICKYIHLPVQSGSSRVLSLMNRTYDREWYINRIEAIRTIVPDCAVSSDIIAGFCSETDEDHKDTLSMMAWADYCMSYMFAYSERPGTLAARKYKDDIPEDVKKNRLSEIIALQRAMSDKHNARDVGNTYRVLIEGDSRKSDEEFKGRNSQNKMVVFPKVAGFTPGDYAQVYIESSNSATLIGRIVTI
jgi:tRNA-2-methylthio-N6-dimethylallyladenosine synthase